MVSMKQIVRQFFVVVCLVVHEEISCHQLKGSPIKLPSPSPSECDQMHCLQEVPEFVDRKRRLLLLLLHLSWKTCHGCSGKLVEFCPLLLRGFHRTQLDMQWWQQDFLGLNKRRMLNTFLSRFKWLSHRPVLSDILSSSCTTVPFADKTAILRVATLKAK